MDWNLNADGFFTYANTVIENMMVVVYIVAGISLGFIVVAKIISAFR